MRDHRRTVAAEDFELHHGSPVAIIGGGPAGSFTAIFLSRIGAMAGIDLSIDLFEPRTFDRSGPAGCNHCGGIVSESLVQTLAAEGINLPDVVVQRGIDSYELHMDMGDVRIGSPVGEQRIAAVYRGNGPREGEAIPSRSFDGFLLDTARDLGAVIHKKLVTGLDRDDDGRLRLRFVDGDSGPYDLVVVATGVNSAFGASLNGMTPRRRVKTARTHISEYRADRETIRSVLGSSMHVFMLDLPGVEFAALIPKGDHVTLAMLGHDIDGDVITGFMESPPVRRAMPFERVPGVCSCTPFINVKGARPPYRDRLVMVGDSGVTRLYKDGLGAAYRTAKAAATAAILYGVGERAFEAHYRPVCDDIARDNRYGTVLFKFTWLFRKLPFMRRAVLRMTEREQASASGTGPMSRALWNLFTGSAPYREVFWSTMRPGFLARFAGHIVMSIFPRRKRETADAPT